MYQSFIKPFLFSLPPEKAHYKAIDLFNLGLRMPGGKKTIKALYGFQDASLEKEVFGLKFKNPVGLAAGFDKDGKFFKQMAHLGFGYIEIGTVTPKPQSGNPQPRLFRVVSDRALINRMGFNNDGVEAMVKRLRRGRPKDIILGGNIGKNKVTPNEQAVDDYLICFMKLHDYVDYFVVNVSSPNTPGLRSLQDKKPLTHILSALKAENIKKDQPKPILLKIAPDLNESQLDDIVDIVNDTEIEGLIATNTTIDRGHLSIDQEEIAGIGNGGLSGAPLTSKATEVVSYLSEKSEGAFPIIGVGGIMNGQDAVEKLQAGASLIQIYSGFVYGGPGIIKDINKTILHTQ